MKKTFRKILCLCFLAVFLASTSLLVRQMIYNRSGADAYSHAHALASVSQSRNRNRHATEPTEPVQEETTPPEPVWIPAPVENDPVMEQMAGIDLAALRAENPDVLGWIRIPDTKIDYPLMRGDDNEYYLHHTWNRQPNTMGSIFLECRNNPNLADYNTIIYGHNMANGTMFAQLHRYAEKGFRENHPFVYILSDAGVYRYEVFSAYRAEIDSPVYALSFRQEESRVQLVGHALENSRIDTGIVPEKTDRILTLSTCSGAGYTNRWVVHARLKMVEIL